MLCCLNFQNHCMTHVHFFIPYTIMLTRAVCMCAYDVSCNCHFQKKVRGGTVNLLRSWSGPPAFSLLRRKKGKDYRVWRKV